MKKQTFSDYEYRNRKRKTKREKLLEVMDEIIPWEEWISIIVPYYPSGKRGRPPIGIEIILRMYLLQVWFSLSDEGTEDAIYDSYAIQKASDNSIDWDRVIEHAKSSVRCKVEHPFRIIKCLFGYRKVVYKGLAKDGSRLYMLFTSANLYALASSGQSLAAAW